jgi:hypothetical protein
MFESFVIGPIGLGRFGLARRCVECGAKGATLGGKCTGFGSGCLQRAQPEGDKDGAPGGGATASSGEKPAK